MEKRSHRLDIYPAITRLYVKVKCAEICWVAKIIIWVWCCNLIVRGCHVENLEEKVNHLAEQRLRTKDSTLPSSSCLWAIVYISVARIRSKTIQADLISFGYLSKMSWIFRMYWRGCWNVLDIVKKKKSSGCRQAIKVVMVVYLF